MMKVMALMERVLFILFWPLLFLAALIAYPFKERCAVCRKGRLVCQGDWAGTESFQCDHCGEWIDREY